MIRKKIIIVLVVVLTPFLIFAGLLTYKLVKVHNQGKSTLYPGWIREATTCYLGGADYAYLSNGCGDSCGGKIMLCTMAFDYGCNCGDNACWNGHRCVSETIK